MVSAVIAGVVAFLAIVALLAVVLYIRSHRGNSVSDKVNRQNVNAINTYGVEPEKQQVEFGQKGAARIARTPTSGSGKQEDLQGRFMAMGIIAAGIFGSLSVKLWSMQVLQASDYAKKAEENLYKTVYTPAPRGHICDRDGVAIVKNRTSYTVLASADVANDHDVILRLSTLLGIPYEIVRQRILSTSAGAQSSRVVSSDVSLRNLAYISEHSDAFRGITTEKRTARQYPYGALAAHVLGYVSAASDEDLKNVAEGRDVQSGDIVGKSGIESTYEDVLAGDHGTRTVLTDASGNIKEVVSSTDPTRGNDVYLTLRAGVQQVADLIMRETIAPGGVLGSNYGTAGATVCIDVTNGEIIALSNFPTFTPESFVGGIPQDSWDFFDSDESYHPLMNRVVSGLYPAASTYKAFTAAAALKYKMTDADTAYECYGTWSGFGAAFSQNCWKEGGHGVIDLQQGIAESCDTVFYEIAKNFFYAAEKIGETAMQEEIERYGFGAPTGVDIAGEAIGRVPTPEWKAEYYKDTPEEASWQGGDMTNMVIGQGYVLVTPLQIACGYAGVATGKIFKPHLLKEVRNSQGDVIISKEPELMYEPEQNEADMKLVRDGLKDVISYNGYDSFFSGVDYKVAGKTGTAEVAGKGDYSWFVCYAPADNPKYVCATLIEQGELTLQSSIPIGSAVLKAAMAADDNSLGVTMTSIPGSYTTTSYTIHNNGRGD